METKLMKWKDFYLQHWAVWTIINFILFRQGLRGGWCFVGREPCSVLTNTHCKSLQKNSRYFSHCGEGYVRSWSLMEIDGSLEGKCGWQMTSFTLSLLSSWSLPGLHYSFFLVLGPWQSDHCLPTRLLCQLNILVFL